VPKRDEANSERITPMLLTTNVDFDLAEVHPVIRGFTLHVDGSSVTDDTWIPITHVVIRWAL